jgi:DnaJ-class molecular chaperone
MSREPLKHPHWVQCPKCKGTGQTLVLIPCPGIKPVESPCPNCGGFKKVLKGSNADWGSAN